MHQYRFRFLIPISLSVLLIAGLFLLLPAKQTNAQCGSQASSCKNCHETQGADPVNTDGTTWHTQHAQIDACVSCHAGNPQSTDATQSHTGMVPWNSDIKAGCYSCHPSDYQQLAEQYVAVTGAVLGDTGGAPAAVVPEPTSVTTATVGTMDGGGGIVISEPGTVDYVQQYEQTILGKRFINWGDVIVVVMIIGLLLGGGAFIYWNERRRRGLKGFFTPKPVKPAAEKSVPIVEGYTTEVTELLPLIDQLNPVGRHALKRILVNPDQANEMLHALSHLDPELIRRVESLDKNTRALLVALAGD